MSPAECSELTIRVAAADERSRLREITLAAYEQYSSQMKVTYWESYRQHIVETLDALGAHDAPERVAATEQLVAVHRGETVGTVLFYAPGTSFADEVEAAMSPDCPEARLLAVAPTGRGAGVGRALMEACVERARLSGAPGLVLHTMAMMEAARRLYQRMGFERAPELDFQPAREWFVEGFRLPL